MLGGTLPQTRTNESIWWKHVLGIGRSLDENWFRKNVSCGLGDGCNIGFWKFRWMGNQPFCDLYPNLYAKEVSKDVLVSNRMQRNDENIEWNWMWSDNLSHNDAGQLLELQDLLVEIHLEPGRMDRWRWIPGPIGLFTVNSCYKMLIQSSNMASLDPNVLDAIQNLWKNDVPTKVNIFGWRLLLDKLPTRAALQHRGILHNLNELACTFCFRLLEDSSHVFFNCPFATKVWQAIFQWIGQYINSLQACWNHFQVFGALVKSKNGSRVRHLIWLATTWCIWKLRNQIVFNGAAPDVTQLVEEIKRFSWSWFRGRSGRKTFLSYYEWCVEPLICFQSI
jgi:hypothetical protein